MSGWLGARGLAIMAWLRNCTCQNSSFVRELVSLGSSCHSVGWCFPSLASMCKTCDRENHENREFCGLWKISDKPCQTEFQILKISGFLKVRGSLLFVVQSSGMLGIAASSNLQSMCRGWSKNLRYRPKWKCMQYRYMHGMHPYIHTCIHTAFTSENQFASSVGLSNDQSVRGNT